MKFYLATNYLDQEKFKFIKNELVNDGWVNTFDWVDWARTGERKSDGSYDFSETAELETGGIVDADIVICLLPGARGTHFEMGFAKALGKYVILHCEYEDMFEEDVGGCPFYHFESGVDKIVCPLEELPKRIIGKNIDSINYNKENK